MTDLAQLVLSVDSTSVKTGTAALDGLTAAGARAEAATIGLGGGFKGASAQAAEMAAAAQLSARAAMDQAAGFRVSTDAARVNTLALRETLVVTRELMRGNYTRLPGSLMLLGQGAASQGGVGAYASALLQTLGIIKTVQNAELAEAAAAAASAAAGVESAAARAGANVLAADTEMALARAAMLTSKSSAEEAAAQARLAAAHLATAAAAREAEIAERALAEAQGRSIEASTASAAATRTVMGTVGAALIGVGIATTGAVLGFKAFQAAVDDSGALDRYAQSLVKTKEQLKELEDKVGGFQITWGDVFHGISKAAGDAIGSASMWDAFKEGNKNAFSEALHNAVDFAALSYGVIRGSYQTIVDDWSKFPSIIGDAFYSAVNLAIGALNKLMKAGVDQLNAFIATANKLPFVHVGNVGAPQIGNVANPYAGSKVDSDLHDNISKYTAEGRARINAGLSTISNDIFGAAEQRIRDGLPKERQRRERHPKEAVDHADDTIARLDEQILAAKEKLAGGAVELANLQIQQIDVEKNKTIADAKSQLAQHKITAGEEQHIELQANVLAELKKQAVLREEQTKLLTQQQAAQDQLFSFQSDALKFADQMASTQAEHRKAQLDMLSIEYQQKAYDLQILKAKQQIAGDLAAVALTQGQIDHLPTQLAQQVALTLKKTANPLEQWGQQFKPDQIIEDLQRIQVQGFDGLASAISDAVTGAKSLQQAFSDLARSVVAELIQMTVKMLIFRTLSSIFGGGLDQGSFAGTVAGNNAALGGSLVGLVPTGPLPAFASGGFLDIGGTGGIDKNVLSLNGSPIANVSQGETLGVFPRGRAANNNAPQQIEITLITEPSDDAWGKVGTIAVKTVQGAAPIIVKAAVAGTMKVARRPKLMGR